jgi:hypothetical protein
LIGRVEKLLLLWSTLLAGGSGLIFAWMKYLGRSSEPYSVVGHPWQPWFLSAHLLTSPLLLFAFGLIARDHVLGRYRDKRAQRGRRTGIASALVLVALAASGYGLQVLVGQGPRRVAGFVHLAAGMGYLLAYASHALLASGGARNGGPRVAGRPPARKPRD